MSYCVFEFNKCRRWKQNQSLLSLVNSSYKPRELKLTESGISKKNCQPVTQGCVLRGFETRLKVLRCFSSRKRQSRVSYSLIYTNSSSLTLVASKRAQLCRLNRHENVQFSLKRKESVSRKKYTSLKTYNGNELRTMTWETKYILPG